MFLILILFFPILVFGAEVHLRVSNLANDSGFIHFALYNNEENFLKDDGKLLGFKEETFTIINEGVVLKDLASGYYAIAIYHDENSNDEFDTIFGIPTEKYGFSNNAKVFLAPPSYEETSFFLNENEVKKLTIEIK